MCRNEYIFIKIGRGKKMNKISPSVIRKINRLALRMIPLVPAPELLDIIEELSSSKKSISKKN